MLKGLCCAALSFSAHNTWTVIPAYLYIASLLADNHRLSADMKNCPWAVTKVPADGQ